VIEQLPQLAKELPVGRKISKPFVFDTDSLLERSTELKLMAIYIFTLGFASLLALIKGLPNTELVKNIGIEMHQVCVVALSTFLTVMDSEMSKRGVLEVSPWIITGRWY
jgi:hypothetical protein